MHAGRTEQQTAASEFDVCWVRQVSNGVPEQATITKRVRMEVNLGVTEVGLRKQESDSGNH
jgi:hypothetical protein